MAAKVAEMPIKQGEAKTRDRRKKFVSIAEKRTANAIRAIRTIGKLANRSAYEFEDQDIKKITGTLSKEIDELKHRFLRKGGKETVEFKL